MSMGSNVVIEDLIGLGACDGVDRQNCIKALSKVLNMKTGGRGFAERIMGDEFEKFRAQTREAFKVFSAAAGQPVVDNGDDEADHYAETDDAIE